MPAVRATKLLVDAAPKTFNRCKTTDLTVSKNDKFLSRKIRKLKKILKSSRNFFRIHNSVAPSNLYFEEWQNHRDTIEEQMQNYENELMEMNKLLSKSRNTRIVNSSDSNSSSLERVQNAANENCDNCENCENWDSWDDRRLRAHAQFKLSPPSPSPPPYAEMRSQTRLLDSICYVFMAGQVVPVPVKLGNAKIPEGVMWIVYRPDFDLGYRRNLYEYEVSSNQLARAQCPVLV